MNPNLDTSPSLHLPEPVAPGGPVNYEQPPAGVSPELAPIAARPETASLQPPTPTFTLPAQGGAAVPPPPAASIQPIPAAPAVADDSDLIEKEWVLKAKQIIQSTRSDPYQQNGQLAAFKADYMQKRYNKTVKLSE